MRRLFVLGAAAGVVALALVGCGDSSTEPESTVAPATAAAVTTTTMAATTTTTTEAPTTTTEAAATTTEAFEGALLSLSFDGENCTYEGPTELTTEPAELVFSNESEGDGYVSVIKLDPGKTLEDVIEYNGGDPTSKHAPPWARALGTFVPVPVGETKTFNLNLQPASYVMACARTDPSLLVWLGTGLTVEG